MIDGRIYYVPVKIINGSATPAQVAFLGGRMLKGIMMPSAWTGTTITFQGTRNNTEGNPDTAELRDVYDDAGAEVSVTVAASRYVVFGQALAQKMAGLDFVLVRSGTAGAPVAQAAERNFLLVTAVSTL